MSTILEVKDIAISFGGIKAVQGASFKIEQGEILGLIGPNGSGKSTCVNLITNTCKVDRGDVIFQGKVIPTSVGITERAKMGITRTFQTPKPFGNLNVYDNIFTIALQGRSYPEAHQKTEEILEKMELTPLAYTLSAKLPIEKRKWMDMARLLTLDPKIIMMDEVMGGLNPSEMESSLEMVKKLNRDGITILFIEHVMKAVVNLCDRVVVLNEGKVLCDGVPEEVLKRQDVIDAYLGGGKKHAEN